MTAFFDADAAHPQAMTVQRAGMSMTEAPPAVSNGPFHVQMLLSSHQDGDVTAMRAVMPPGVVTHWHSHPAGQLLFVLDGVGWAQREGGAPVELRPGDSVWFAPEERHWHGADARSAFSYLSVQAVKNGTAVCWMEPVTNRGQAS
ncbi:cupin [Xaviernesmea oryzae]|uniref:Cupin n=1 Tax=Xaviernesmea oryzae TaxID=464029 RepID=A0A1Q9B1U1_9HYPH|nr:cupin domain-containing protein [Xaviernesmea oryzae]OLP61974.1 cupin [Xaviernesmea oryzae]SEK98811.1 Cupin domain protein [Xaviernesmea oryzae]